MIYRYLAFGIPVISEIELPALLAFEQQSEGENPVYVKTGTVPADLQEGAQYADSFTYCNANEMIYTVPGKIKFYIAHGNHIIIEPANNTAYAANLIYFYSNALAAILYQRNLIPFHVSGVFTEPDKVVLFAAPSRTGKSTLALKLQELGYPPFTDDTAVLFIENKRCYARASYPMMRLWENTLSQQALLQAGDKQPIYENSELDKYGFSFHRQFTPGPVEVKQLIFLQEEGTEVQIRPIKSLDAFIALCNNVYRCHWIPAMQKNTLQFTLISQVLNTIPSLLAIRPKGLNSFTHFPLAIKKVLQNDQN